MATELYSEYGGFAAGWTGSLEVLSFIVTNGRGD